MWQYCGNITEQQNSTKIKSKMFCTFGTCRPAGGEHGHCSVGFFSQMGRRRGEEIDDDAVACWFRIFVGWRFRLSWWRCLPQKGMLTCKKEREGERERIVWIVGIVWIVLYHKQYAFFSGVNLNWYDRIQSWICCCWSTTDKRRAV